MKVETVKVVNHAVDLRFAGSPAPARCSVMMSPRGLPEAFTRCLSSPRWLFILDDGRSVWVCKLHANKGERAGSLNVEDAAIGAAA
jgi:hypothetical protein